MIVKKSDIKKCESCGKSNVLLIIDNKDGSYKCADCRNKKEESYKEGV